MSASIAALSHKQNERKTPLKNVVQWCALIQVSSLLHLICILRHICLLYFVYVRAAITCDPLANITFGHYNNINCVTQKSFYNDTCEVMCDFGYVLHGPPEHRCTLKWEWAPNTKGHCERKHLLCCINNGITLSPSWCQYYLVHSL